MNNEFIKIYSDFLKKKLSPDRKLKIVFDCSNGTTGLILKELFKANHLINYKLINQTPNGNFPAHEPNPLTSNALNQLQQEVKKQKANLGVIFDADGDRVFFVDNLGRFIDPDIISRLLIWHLNPKKIVIDVRTGWLIKKIKNQRSPQQNKFATWQAKIKIFESRAGHYFIKKLMREINADFGAEKSGHYYFRISDTNLRMHANVANKNEKYFYYDDGGLAAIEVINAVSKLPYLMANFNDLLPQYYRSGEINIKMNYELGIRNYENLLRKIENNFKKQSTKISHLDGLTIESGDWWFNLRPSNTEPVIRLNIEAENQNIVEHLEKEIINALTTLKV